MRFDMVLWHTPNGTGRCSVAQRCDTLSQKRPVLMYAYLQHQMLAAKERKLQLTQF